jgi:molybdenum cofactor cytidylyltransferase
MRASVAFALGEIRRLFSPYTRDAWLAAPADLPRLSAAVIDRLIEEHRRDPSGALVPTVQQRRGHPVLFPWNWATRVRQLGAEEGLNSLLREGRTQEVDCSDLIQAVELNDVDTPEDYQGLTSGR